MSTVAFCLASILATVGQCQGGNCSRWSTSSGWQVVEPQMVTTTQVVKEKDEKIKALEAKVATLEATAKSLEAQAQSLVADNGRVQALEARLSEMETKLDKIVEAAEQQNMLLSKQMSVIKTIQDSTVKYDLLEDPKLSLLD